MNIDFLRRGQRAVLEIKSLFLSYGFSEYKLSGLEEYSLYAENQSFLAGKDVITFNAGNKLMALRPDVTLSIIKNASVDGTNKLFYDEKVYRKNECGGFSEVSQIGAEVIGTVDLAAEAELTRLMLKTLALTGENYVLDLSHIGIIIALLDKLGFYGGDRTFALSCLRQKNAHDFLRFASQKEADSEISLAFARLMDIPPEPQKALLNLKELKRPEISRFIDELEQLVSLINSDRININFSADGDAEYYNGLIFKGYVEGAPRAVLSGGRYDKLLQKFGKYAQAIGFALYFGELSRFFDDLPSSPDAVIIYNDSNIAAALERAERARSVGFRALLTRAVPSGFKGKIIYAEGE